jgi:tRNA A37 threonylcarbamoyladenosine dehydratase
MINFEDWKSRTELLLGKENIEKLHHSHVLIAGLGGVGGYAAEALCRAGIGQLTIVDNDVVSATNRNRQLLALKRNEGKSKVDIAEERLYDINPDLILYSIKTYLKGEKIPEIFQSNFDYVVDAIDTLSPKIFFIKNCLERSFPLISSMGSGGKLDPSQIKTGDVSESYGCPFAQIVRKKLHGWGIRTGFKVVYSPEPVPKSAVVVTDNEANKKSTVGTISYMPAIFGLTAASIVIRDLIKK